jgi:U2 small nuclear ribonucleoprotein A'
MVLLGHDPSEPLACCHRTYAYLQDQHDAIDLTDNSVTTLANFPLMRRLRSLHLANNHIMSISPSLHLSLPNLTTLVLTNNSLAQLGDLEPLKDCRALQFLSLLGNPVREKKYYRDWVIWRCKALRVLDFMRIREKVCRCLTFRVNFKPSSP